MNPSLSSGTLNGSLLLYLLFALVVTGSRAAETSKSGHMQLTSTAFAEGEPIPAKYSCEDKNVSPPLKWTGAPPGTTSLTLIVDDPDAPGTTWVHWVLYDLPGSTAELPENIEKGQRLSNGARQGLNDFKHLGYGGPCPP